MTKARETARLLSSDVFTVSGTPANVGVGSTTPSTKLNVDGIISADGLNVAGVVTASTFSGNITGTATTAEYAISAGYATTAGISTEAITATTAGYATTAGISSESVYATTAGISTEATTAGYATTAGISTVSQGLTGTPNVEVGVVTATSLSGSGAGITNINASNISTGYVNTARLGSGTANCTTFLRGDQTWGVAGGGYENYRVFTSSCPFFPLPANTTQVKVTATGGGQGYSGICPATYINGGGAGATGVAVVNISGSSNLSIVVGSAGANCQCCGGNSCVTGPAGTYVVACGGNYNASCSAFPLPAPCYQSTANICSAGAPTGFSLYYNSYYYITGLGAASVYGSGPGCGGGGGGSGSRNVSNDLMCRYNAGNGIVIIEY